MDKNIEIILEELLKLFSQDSAVREYQEVAALVKDDPELRFLQDSIRKYQKKATWADFYGQQNFSEDNGNLVRKKRQRLLNDPLVSEYQEKLSEANDLLQYVTRLIQEEVEQNLK